MNGVARGSSRRKRLLAIVLFSMIFLSGCLGGIRKIQQTDADSEIVLEVWHTFAAESKEEEVFMNSVSSFELYPNVTVEVTMVPFGNADQLFMTAAQGGQALI